LESLKAKGKPCWSWIRFGCCNLTGNSLLSVCMAKLSYWHLAKVEKQKLQLLWLNVPIY